MKRKIFDMGAGRLLCGPEIVIPKRPVPRNLTPCHLYFAFFFFRKFPLFCGRGNREGTPIDEAIMYSHFSSFLAGRPQISSGTQPKPPQNLAGTTHLPRTSPGTSPEPLQNFFQTDAKPIPNRSQTDPKPTRDRPQTSLDFGCCDRT